MTWPTCRDQMVSIVEGTTPSTKKYGASPRFHHVSAAMEEGKLPDTRGFWFELTSLAMKGHLSAGLPRWLRYEVELVAFYRRTSRPADLLELVAADHLAVTKRLGDPSLWGQPSSTIESLYLGEDLIAETDLEPIEMDGRLAGVITRTRMTAEFRES